MKPTVTLESFQPAAFGEGEALAMIMGAVSEILSVTCADAEFPAASVAVPLMIWLAPGVITTCGAGHVAIPERVSAQVKVTVTAELFQPAEFGAGEATAVIVGGVLSMLTVTVALTLFPATSVTVAVTA
jgi:hypothetical protein